MTETITVNARQYTLPHAPLVVVCVDGCEPDYLDAAMASGRMPWLAEQLAQGCTRLTANCVVPSFTNPNNLSIVTGAPPAVHGISGNFFLEPDSGEAVMMNEVRFLTAPTLFQAFAKAGAHIAIITAKDKLRGLLGHGLDFDGTGHLCFSAEKADQATLAGNGIDNLLEIVGRPLPDVYSAALSEFVFAAGVVLMEQQRPDVMYLSTTDYIQHKHAPGTPVADDFYQMMDGHLAKLHAAGATIAMTADHGMNAKHDSNGAPNVLYLQDLLDDWLGKDTAQVILPITDPYVVHHGALGSYATVYLKEGIDIASVSERLAERAEVEYVGNKAKAASDFELPPERLGDLVVVSTRNITLGSAEADHDLSGLDAPLRSHGGISEQRVPLIFNRKLERLVPGHTYRNFDAFDLAINHVTEETA